MKGMVEAILSYVIKAIDESSSVMDRIKSSVGLLGSSLSGLGGGFAQVGNVMTGFAAGGVAGAAITALGEVAQGLQSCIKEAGASEAVFTSLGAAVDRSGTAWSSVADGTKKALLAMQATTTYSDEQLAGALNKMLTFGLSYDQAMKALAATIDFAAAKHMDLESAATLVGKAVDGNTAIMKRYGVDITVAKDATDKFTPVLTALNDQFGGAAQAAASTYVGLQERLKNATQEVGEKIGTIMLPALASMTEGMLPVVDQLGKGVDALSAWLTEVGKMPEVQGAVKFLQDAFAGLWTYLQGLWGFMVDQFGPVLTELVGAFKELWDALSPIGDALRELYGAFSDNGNIDIFKEMLKIVVLEIRAVATVIKDVAPYIKQFADAFKAAADFISPILTVMVADIRGFLDALKGVFQDFYNWLIGGSLWSDLWLAVISKTGEAISQLLGDLGSKFFEPMKTAFTNALERVQSAWSKGWESVQTTFNTVTRQIQTDLNTRLDTMIADLRESTNQYAPTAALALQGMQSAMNGGMSLIHGDWQGFLDGMSHAMGRYWQAIQGATTTAFGQMQASFTTALQTIQNTWQTGWQAVQTTYTTISTQIGTGINTQLEAWKTSISTSTSQYAPIATQALTAMQSSVNIGMQLIQGDWQGALTSIQNALTQWGGVATGIMTGIMGALEGAVSAGVSAIEGMFSSLVASAQGTISTLQGMFSQAQSLVSSIAQQTVQAATTLGQGIAAATAPVQTLSDEFGNMWQGVYDGANWLWTQLVGTSIWTDLMETMQSQAYSALGNIAGAFQDMSLAIPSTIPYIPATASTSAPASADEFGGSTRAVVSDNSDHCHVGRQVISKTVEKRIVSNIDYRGKR